MDGKTALRARRVTYIMLATLLFLFALRLFLGRLLAAALPFLFAYLAARAVFPAAAFLSKRTKLPERIASVILTLLLLLGVGLLFVFLLWRLAIEAGEVLTDLLNDPDRIEPFVSAIRGALRSLASHLPGGAGETLFSEEHLSGMLRAGLTTALSKVTGAVGAFLSRIPAFVFAVLVAFVSAFYCASDPDLIRTALRRVIPADWQGTAERIGNGALRGLWVVIRAYGILFGVTFGILLFGLLLLRVPFALLVSFLVALFDLLPVLGAGGILVPWGIVSLLSGRAAFGVCLFVLSFLIVIVRQILEPHLVGRGLGIHPLLALFSMYAGLKLAGAGGLVLGPAIAVMVSKKTFRKNE